MRTQVRITYTSKIIRPSDEINRCPHLHLQTSPSTLPNTQHISKHTTCIYLHQRHRHYCTIITNNTHTPCIHTHLGRDERRCCECCSRICASVHVCKETSRHVCEETSGQGGRGAKGVRGHRGKGAEEQWNKGARGSGQVCKYLTVLLNTLWQSGD
jgi:hypothetical protein